MRCHSLTSFAFSLGSVIDTNSFFINILFYSSNAIVVSVSAACSPAPNIPLLISTLSPCCHTSSALSSAEPPFLQATHFSPSCLNSALAPVSYCLISSSRPKSLLILRVAMSSPSILVLECVRYFQSSKAKAPQ